MHIRNGINQGGKRRRPAGPRRGETESSALVYPFQSGTMLVDIKADKGRGTPGGRRGESAAGSAGERNNA